MDPILYPTVLELANNMTLHQRYHLAKVLSNGVLSNGFVIDRTTLMMVMGNDLVARVGSYEELLGKRNGVFLLSLPDLPCRN
jgi:hypothetical protein